jgi:hypothetical protein
MSKELETTKAEDRRLRERLELLARKTEVLERRLAEAVGTAAIPVAEVKFAGKWPDRKKFEPTVVNEKALADQSFEEFPALRPYPGHACISLSGGKYRIKGFSVIGLRGSKLAAMVERVARLQRQGMDFVPVFITDSTEFDTFRRHGYVFEYIPGAEAQEAAPGSCSWEKRVAERTAMIKKKWGLTEIVNLASSRQAED